MRVYHGTRSSIADVIIREGLRSSLGYDRARWYMVAADYASAAHHAHGYEGTPVVLELDVPIGPRNRRWDGEQWLWPPHELTWDGKPTRWWALRQPLPARFVKRVSFV